MMSSVAILASILLLVGITRLYEKRCAYAEKLKQNDRFAIGLGEEFGNEGNGLHAAAAGAGRGAKARPVEPRFEGKGDRSQVCGAPEIYVLVSTIEC